MKLDYIITGMPRTAKAWLANYLTFGDSYCAFEPFREGVDDKYLPAGYSKLGIADTSAPLFQDRIIKGNHGAKWIVMERPYSEIASSVKNLGFKPDQRLHTLSVKLSELVGKVDAIVIPYPTLCSSLDKIEGHLGIHIPIERRDMLCSLTVTARKPNLYSSKTEIEPARFTPKNKEYMDLLWTICAPNAQAYKWVTQVVETALVWDHVIDNDPIDYHMTDRAFKALLTEWAINPFWTANAHSLLPTISSSISNWQCSYLDEMCKDRAYSIYEDVPAAVAFILGGQARVDQFLPRLRVLVKHLRREDDARDGAKK